MINTGTFKFDQIDEEDAEESYIKTNERILTIEMFDPLSP